MRAAPFHFVYLSEMNDSSLDDLLRQSASRSEAALPGTFQQNVRREIRQRKETEPRFAGSLFDLVLRPQVLFASLVLAVALGIGFGARSEDPTIAETRRALELEVFSASAPALPSTLLADRL